MKKNLEYGSENVKIKLFKDNSNYSQDIFVCLNGKSYLIQRGVEVEIPYAVARVLEQSAQADRETAESLIQLQQKANNL